MSTRKTATNNGFLLFKDQLPILENIPNENLGEAIKLLLQNFDNMQKIDTNPLTNMAYELIATNIRRYREQSNKAREDGLRGGNPTLKGTVKGTVKSTVIPTHKQQDNTIQDNKIFNVPSKDDIKQYCNIMAKKIDIDTFYEYYSVSNWKDKDGLPLNWKQRIISWSKRHREEEPSLDLGGLF